MPNPVSVIIESGCQLSRCLYCALYAYQFDDFSLQQRLGSCEQLTMSCREHFDRVSQSSQTVRASDMRYSAKYSLIFCFLHKVNPLSRADELFSRPLAPEIDDCHRVMNFFFRRRLLPSIWVRIWNLYRISLERLYLRRERSVGLNLAEKSCKTMGRLDHRW